MQVIGRGLAEAPNRGHSHGQLQAEVSEDGRILMQGKRETEDRKPVKVPVEKDGWSVGLPSLFPVSHSAYSLIERNGWIKLEDLTGAKMRQQGKSFLAECDWPCRIRLRKRCRVMRPVLATGCGGQSWVM
eukprot:Skav236296  [mRNA]  locus=scaffold1398:21697:22782:+ [translate_table: standard]